MSGGSIEVTAGTVPTLHRLRAALRVARIIDANGAPVDKLRASYLRIPTDGMFHPSELRAGERLLIRSGLLQEEAETLNPRARFFDFSGLGDTEACRMLLALLLQHDPPVWLPIIADGSAIAEEFIPTSEFDKLCQVFSNTDEREAFLLAAARQFDQELLSALGAAGEEAVVAACQTELLANGRPDLAAEVNRVSAISDQLGYDVVAPRLCGCSRRLEVKTTGQAGNVVTFFLSRNEANFGRRDPNWALVICAQNPHGTVTVEGWCAMYTLLPLLPNDPESEAPARGRWETVRIHLPRGSLQPGLPSVL